MHITNCLNIDQNIGEDECDVTTDTNVSSGVLVHFLQRFTPIAPVWHYSLNCSLVCKVTGWRQLHQQPCQGDLRVLFLGEDWDARRLKDCDLHQSAVRFHWLPIVIGYHKELQWSKRKHVNKRHMQMQALN